MADSQYTKALIDLLTETLTELTNRDGRYSNVVDSIIRTSNSDVPMWSLFTDKGLSSVETLYLTKDPVMWANLQSLTRDMILLSGLGAADLKEVNKHLYSANCLVFDPTKPPDDKDLKLFTECPWYTTLLLLEPITIIVTPEY